MYASKELADDDLEDNLSKKQRLSDSRSIVRDQQEDDRDALFLKGPQDDVQCRSVR